MTRLSSLPGLVLREARAQARRRIGIRTDVIKKWRASVVWERRTSGWFPCMSSVFPHQRKKPGNEK
jgi:hypothetical protein